MDYWTRYSTAEFFRRPAAGVWAPADQVRHLTKAIRAVAKGLSLPRAFLRILFGWPRRPSRSYAALVIDYEAALGPGVSAGRFAPGEMAQHTEADRARVMEFHARAVHGVCSAMGRWTEQSLDRYALPHPLLGKLTARELAFFTLLHNVHHVQIAERRRLAVTATGVHEH